MASTKLLVLVAMAVALASLAAVGAARPGPDRVTKIKLALQWDAASNSKVFGPAPLPTTAKSFGEGYVKDYPLYSSVEKKKEVGRARGLYFTDDKNGAINQEINTFTFYAGKYKGSSLTVQGDWVQGATKQELAITGGTGVFAFARGSIRFKNTPTLYLFDGSARLKDVGSS